MITKVTITGADDSVTPLNLALLWKRFPFVEWGILISANNFGRPRYPSLGWLNGLYDMKKQAPEMPLSMHLCGQYVRDLVKGNPITEVREMVQIFERVQLNFHAIKHEHTEGMLKNLALCGLFKEYIFQYDGVNDGIARIVQDSGFKTSALFDKSGGAGILPNEWPDLLVGMKCGYAGGLSPYNLEAQIKLIEAKAGDTEIWIDMETHVRSDDDQILHLGYVTECLTIASQYIKQ